MKGERWVLAIAMLLPSATAAVYFVFLSSGNADSTANPLMRSAYVASKILQFGLPVLWLAIVERSALRIGKLSFRGVGLGIAFGIGAAVFAWAVYLGWLVHSPVLDGVADRIRAKVTEFGAGTPTGFILFAGFIAVVHSLLEEYYWRWFIFGRLRLHVPLTTAMILSGFAFMLHHIIVLNVYFPDWFWLIVVPFSLAIACGGMFWAWLYQRSGSLIGPWVSHLIVDVALMAIGYQLVFA